MIKITDTVKHLIIINILFFAATMAFKEPMYEYLAMHFPKNPLFKPWQLVSHLFMHSNFTASGEITITHLLFNMLGLWMFGSAVEKAIGRNNFVALYFIAGIGAALFSLGIDYIQYSSIYKNLMEIGLTPDAIQAMMDTNRIVDPRVFDFPKADLSNLYGIYHSRAVGASGSIFGVLIASAVIYPKAKMGPMFLPISFEARYFIPVILVAEMYFGFLRTNDNIGHFAHIGGAIFGFIFIWYLKKKYKKH